MLVDDEVDLRISIKTSLEDSYGDELEIYPVESGIKCIELLKNNEIPDLIILDIMMPDMDGWQVFDRIKANEIWSDIPIVFLTARTDKIAKEAGGFLGDDFIEKPINPKELKSRIDKVLKK
jgi:CheY-like chemotaxis protein